MAYVFDVLLFCFMNNNFLYTNLLFIAIQMKTNFILYQMQ